MRTLVATSETARFSEDAMGLFLDAFRKTKGNSTPESADTLWWFTCLNAVHLFDIHCLAHQRLSCLIVTPLSMVVPLVKLSSPQTAAVCGAGHLP